MTGYLIYGIHWGNLKLFLLQYLQIAANSFIQGNLWDEWCWSVFHSAPCYLFKFLERKVKWFTREEPEYRLGFTLICQLFKKQAWHLFGAISVPIVPLASVTLLNFWYISRSLKKTSYLEDFGYLNPLPTFQLEGPAALFRTFISSPNSWWYNKTKEDWGNGKSLVVSIFPP